MSNSIDPIAGCSTAAVGHTPGPWHAPIRHALSDFVAYFPCPRCDGHGARVTLKDGQKRAVLCERCDGEGQIGATEDDVERASSIGSDNPFCEHDWSFSGTAYGGDDESYRGEGRCRCSLCGADGDA